ncbi:hypothetical protein [Streptomyces kunmingensis]|uniref:hypothetical protein n=1 Tax=Streptomyces kunmingensis TaxID=68225 RepID=UPI003983B7DA
MLLAGVPVVVRVQVRVLHAERLGDQAEADPRTRGAAPGPAAVHDLAPQLSLDALEGQPDRCSGGVAAGVDECFLHDAVPRQLHRARQRLQCGPCPYLDRSSGGTVAVQERLQLPEPGHRLERDRVRGVTQHPQQIAQFAAALPAGRREPVDLGAGQRATPTTSVAASLRGLPPPPIDLLARWART